MGRKKHIPDQFKDHHHPEPNQYEGGRCLWGHEGSYTPSSCSYRWQAHQAARENTSIYHRYATEERTTSIKTSRYVTKKKDASGKDKFYPAFYAADLAPPGPGDWDVDGPPERTMSSVPPGKNFTQHTWPYWHNAHHIIPKGTLHSTIDAETATIPGLGTLIRAALLTAVYNINHKCNMMILPQDKEVAAILKLPRHLALMENDLPDLELKKDACDHKVYSATLRSFLKIVIDEYKEITMKVPNDPHPEEKANLAKARLEGLSRRLMKLIVAVEKGKDSAGKPLAGRPLDAIFRRKDRGKST